MSLEIIRAGFLTVLQDYGRFGQQHFGITNSGPMDEHAFLWANKLLDNDYNAAQLEICMGGFEARFIKPTVISICGADLTPTINKNAINTWQSYAVKAGDILKLESANSGLYAYLAIKGGFIVETQLSSCATVMREQLGGLHKNGKKIANNDVLECKENTQTSSLVVPDVFIPKYEDDIRLRFIPNRSENGCDSNALNQFIQQTFTLSQQINRMGYRLQGQPIQQQKTNIISQGLSLGTIQLPQDGQPIVLMKDKQTIGGYPQLGCVAYLDLAKLSQSKPGTTVTFEAVEIKDITDELTDHLNYFNVKPQSTTTKI